MFQTSKNPPLHCRVARWFRPKIPILAHFRGSCNGRCWVYFRDIWYILRPVDTIYGHLIQFRYVHLVYFVAIWYIVWTFGIFCGNWVCFSPYWYIVKRKIWQPCCIASFADICIHGIVGQNFASHRRQERGTVSNWGQFGKGSRITVRIEIRIRVTWWVRQNYRPKRSPMFVKINAYP
jgi:hypothetical protein